jgi:hypothetical protein
LESGGASPAIQPRAGGAGKSTEFWPRNFRWLLVFRVYALIWTRLLLRLGEKYFADLITVCQALWRNYFLWREI